MWINSICLEINYTRNCMNILFLLFFLDDDKYDYNNEDWKHLAIYLNFISTIIYYIANLVLFFYIEPLFEAWVGSVQAKSYYTRDNY